jgi:excisionase family DNA binding protein
MKTPTAANTTAPKDGFATVDQAGQFLNCGRVTIYAMMRDDQLPSTKIRNARRIPWAALHKLTEVAMEGGAS